MDVMLCGTPGPTCPGRCIAQCEDVTNLRLAIAAVREEKAEAERERDEWEGVARVASNAVNRQISYTESLHAQLAAVREKIETARNHAIGVTTTDPRSSGRLMHCIEELEAAFALTPADAVEKWERVDALVNAVRDALELDAKGFSMPTKPMRDALAALEGGG